MKKVRLEKNLTQETIAHILEMSQSNYAKIESNQYDVKMDKILEYAEKLDIFPESLVDEGFILNFFGGTYHEWQVYNNKTTDIDNKLEAQYEARIKDLQNTIEILQNALAKK